MFQFLSLSLFSLSHPFSFAMLFFFFLLFMLHLFVLRVHKAIIVHRAPQKTHYFRHCICVSTMSDHCMRCVFFYSLLGCLRLRAGGGVGFFFRWVDDLTWYTIFFSYYISFIHFFPLLWTMYWEQATGMNKKRILLSCVPGFSFLSRML